MKTRIMDSINKENCTISIVGLGYVGLPLAVTFAKSGYQVIGVDTSQEKVDLVNKGSNYIADIENDDLKELVVKKLISATTDFSVVSDCEVIIICVPTPLEKHQQPDITYVESSTINIAKYLKKGSVVILESTTYPGTTEELLKPILEKGSGLICNEDFYLGFSPERVDPGNTVFKTNNTPKVVGGIGKDATEVIAELYRSVLTGEVIETSSPAVAEMSKVLENTYRNINIGLINEFAILANKMGIDIWEVIEVAKTKPYGFQAFYPGPGLGGHCIPLDPYYLSWKAREYGFHTSMIECSMMINDNMPDYCIERISKILNRFKKSINGSKILVLGIAYKPDIDDYRESPAILVIDKLKVSGAKVDFYDPWIKEYKHNNEVFQGLSNLESNVISSYDLIVITTAHKNIDYQLVIDNAKVVFDTRNATRENDIRGVVELL